MRMTTRLRELLKKGLVVAPGIYDPLTARLAQLAGFEAVHMTGLGVEASQLAAPDLGMLSMREVVDHAARICAALDIPVMADIDTGFGGILNVQRSIREFERAGVGGVHIEDQALPKHCPLLSGRQVISREQAVDRVKAALDARTDPDLVISARTDAEVISYEEMIERCNLFLEAGADLVMPITIATKGQDLFFSNSPDAQMAIHEKMIKEINGPVMGFGSGPPAGYTNADLERIGFALIMYSASAIGVAMNAVAELFAAMKRDDTDQKYLATHPGPYLNPLELMRAARLDEYVATEEKYLSSI